MRGGGGGSRSSVPINRRPKAIAGVATASRQGSKQVAAGMSASDRYGMQKGGRLAANRRNQTAVMGAVQSKPMCNSIWEEEHCGDDVKAAVGDQGRLDPSGGQLPSHPPAPPTGAMPTLAEVAEAAAGDMAAAARREALFERLQRQRAEALLAGARKVVAALKTRVRLTQRQLDVLRATTVSGEEHGRVLTEVANLKDALKAAKLESSRRQKALQMLQALAQHNLLQGGPSSNGAGGSVPSQGQDEGVGASEPLAAHAAASAAMAATAAATAAAASAEQAMQALSPGPGPAAALRPAHTDPGFLVSSSNSGYLASPGPTLVPLPAAPAGGDDPFAQAAATAAAAAASAGAALAAERAGRELVEGKLREARLALERKTAHSK